MLNALGLSGGKDSTVLAFLLKEREPELDMQYICTPTGNELPEMVEHWLNLGEKLGKPLIRITNQERTLYDIIDLNGMIPNFRARFCTRQLKIEPTIAWCVRHAPVTLHVGLRADEETREGIYGDLVKSRFYFREIGWGLKQVLGYAVMLREKFGIVIPERTDCGDCYHQRIREWWNYWRKYPDRFWHAAAKETAMGHTFRSPGRDTWPVSLADLGAEFQRLWDLGCHDFKACQDRRDIERGRKPRKEREERQGELCRVCSL